MYPTIEAALERAQERAGTTEEEFLTEILTLSAGVDPQGDTQYRPFYAAAKFLEQNRSAQTLAQAGDVKFTGLSKPIESLLGLQAAMDSALGLIVPPGFEAIPPDTSQSANSKPIRFSSLAVRVSPQP